MSERRFSMWSRLGRRLGGGAAVMIAVGASVAPVHALGPLPAASPDTATPVATATTEPSTVATSVATATTEPSTVASTTPPTAATTDSADDGVTSSTSTIGVVIGSIGVVVLLGIAAWWMVRRDDEDEAPHPPGPSSYSDLI